MGGCVGLLGCVPGCERAREGAQLLRVCGCLGVCVCGVCGVWSVECGVCCVVCGVWCVCVCVCGVCVCCVWSVVCGVWWVCVCVLCVCVRVGWCDVPRCVAVSFF